MDRYYLGILVSFYLFISAICASPYEQKVLSAQSNRAVYDIPKHSQIGLIIDAGSSGSRIHAYYWKKSSKRSHYNQVLPLMYKDKNEQISFKIAPGLSSIEPDNVAQYLKPLIDQTTSIFKKSSKTIPIVLKATAGLRLLPKNKQQALLGATSKYFSDKKQVPFRFNHKYGAQIITGNDEGLYGWLTVNILKNRTLSHSLPTALVLDLGNASTQVTYETPQAPLKEGYVAKISDIKYNLYSHSYLGLGGNAASVTYTQALLKASNTTGPVEDPCGLKGDLRSVKNTDGSDIQIVGTGQFQQCLQTVQSTLMKPSSDCPIAPCSINGTYMPDIPKQTPIHAISGFAVVAYALDCHGEGQSTRCILHRHPKNALASCPAIRRLNFQAQAALQA
ncbi:nucleoside phosphatase GDA1/CD39 [Syncephalis fuscata]|nr:nucleoside phosphatase GDA1/CD39 [Syncephalis fuscata]